MNDPFSNNCNIIYSDIKVAQNTVDLKNIITRFHNTLDHIYQQKLKSEKAKIDCQEGCFYCCHLIVDAFPGEVFRIVDHIRTHFSQGTIDHLIQSADEVRKKIELMTLQEQQKTAIACPLLKNCRCSIYPLRPSFCRVFHSTDVNVCKTFHRQADSNLLQPVLLEVKIQTRLYIEALQVAFYKAGYDCKPYDLSTALFESLSTKGKENRWLHRESVYSRQAVAKAYKPINEGESFYAI